MGFYQDLLDPKILELRRLRAQHGRRGLLRLRKICRKKGAHQWAEFQADGSTYYYCTRCFHWPFPHGGDRPLPEAPIPPGRAIDRARPLPNPDWFGEPLPVGQLFGLTRYRSRAACRVVTHPNGWEIRLVVRGEILRSQVCRSEEAVFATGDLWKAALEKLNWR